MPPIFEVCWRRFDQRPRGLSTRTEAVQETDGCRTLIPAISDLTNQAITEAQRVGFVERTRGKPI